MKVLISGDHKWTDREAIRAWLAKLQDWGYTGLITGGARGADEIAKVEALFIGFDVFVIKPDWETHGLAAVTERNRRMLDLEPKLVIVCNPESPLLLDLIAEARRRGIEVLIEPHSRSLEVSPPTALRDRIKGFSIYLCAGRYDKFSIKLAKLSWRICLGWIAIAVVRWDIESVSRVLVDILDTKEE